MLFYSKIILTYIIVKKKKYWECNTKEHFIITYTLYNKYSKVQDFIIWNFHEYYFRLYACTFKFLLNI